MSFQEKWRWVYLGVAAVTNLAYVAIILGRAQGTPITEVSYAWPMIGAIGVTIVGTIAGSIMAAIAEYRAGERRFEPDERDVGIHRHGEAIGYAVFSVGILFPLGLTMAEVAHFWIGNAIYMTGILTSLISAAVKIAAYRRGY